MISAARFTFYCGMFAATFALYGCGNDHSKSGEPWTVSEADSEIVNGPPPTTVPPGRNNADPNPTPPPPDPNPNPDPDPTDPPPPPPPNDDGTEPLPAPCSTPDRPDRCDSDPSNFDWDTAAIIDSLRIMGTETEPECCFDFTGDGQIDNSYGSNLAGFGFLPEINADLDTAMSTGRPAIVLEFEPSGSAFRLNWWYAAWGPTMMGIAPSGNEVLLDSDGIDAGVQPHTYFPSTTVTSTRVVASGGTILLPITFFGVPVTPLPLRNVRLEADISEPYPTLSGRFGGALRVTDIYATLNRFVDAQCDCLGLNEPLLDKQTGQCSPDADVNACSGDCASVGESCSLYGALALFADLDRDGDGLNDAISIGATFTAVPATIIGTTR